MKNPTTIKKHLKNNSNIILVILTHLEEGVEMRRFLHEEKKKHNSSSEIKLYSITTPEVYSQNTNLLLANKGDDLIFTIGKDAEEWLENSKISFTPLNNISSYFSPQKNEGLRLIHKHSIDPFYIDRILISGDTVSESIKEIEKSIIEKISSPSNHNFTVIDDLPFSIVANCPDAVEKNGNTVLLTHNNFGDSELYCGSKPDTIMDEAIKTLSKDNIISSTNGPLYKILNEDIFLEVLEKRYMDLLLTKNAISLDFYIKNEEKIRQGDVRYIQVNCDIEVNHNDKKVILSNSFGEKELTYSPLLESKKNTTVCVEVREERISPSPKQPSPKQPSPNMELGIKIGNKNGY